VPEVKGKGYPSLARSGIWQFASHSPAISTARCALQIHVFLRFSHWLMGASALAFLLSAPGAMAEAFDWSVGAYAGQYYDSEPARWIQGGGNYQDQYLVALTASKTLWRSETLPLAVELDAMLGQQTGVASLTEIALAPVVRWSSFPWNRLLQTDLRLGPLGLSTTSSVSPLERGTNGKGSQTLNFLMIELAVSDPARPSQEFFARLHHRCTIYDLLNDYGANGEDFFAMGYRYRF
jgi:hypothetical protein